MLGAHLWHLKPCPDYKYILQRTGVKVCQVQAHFRFGGLASNKWWFSAKKTQKKIFLFFDSVIIEMTSHPNLAFEIRDYIHLGIFFSDKWIMVMCDQYRVIIFYWSNSESHFVQIKLITLIHLKCYSSILLIHFLIHSKSFNFGSLRLSKYRSLLTIVDLTKVITE